MLSDFPRPASTALAVALPLIFGCVTPSPARAHLIPPDDQDVVGVTILEDGKTILLATPGRERSGQNWRFRSFDTSDLPQPLSQPVLSVSGTKLFLQASGGRALVLDLMRRDRQQDALQYVDPRDPAIDGAAGRHAHRLPSQRFVVIRDGSRHVVDDVGTARLEYPVARAPDAAILADGDAQEPFMTRTEASLRSALRIDRLSMTDTAIGLLLWSLGAEASETDAARGRRLGDWQFFRVTPDPELYVPVLEVAQEEDVFPGPFETLERLGGSRGWSSPKLFDRYRRQDLQERRKDCTIYFRVHSDPGAWTIEYWFYYPFDVGGLKGHLHDPEHVFVEVDKLGGTVRSVNAAAHGFLAGNNIYSTTRASARPADLPLFVMAELDKHAAAPDMNRDGIFTPGIDENEYRERAKVWGVRDVVGTNNNHLLPYDRTMTLPRRAEDYLASINILERFPHEQRLAAQACCRLMPLPVEPPRQTTCTEATTECAIASVMLHPDFVSRTTIVKEWVFPQSFLRATYGLGPGLGVHSVGLGYSVDLDRTPGFGRLLPLPGRVGADAFAWKRDDPGHLKSEHQTAHLDGQGVGFGFRYEQFLSNLFGVHSSIRVYSPPISEMWMTFGPMVEIPIRNAGNVNLMTGLSVQPGGSPRFEIRISTGFWKPRLASVGLAAGSDRRP